MSVYFRRFLFVNFVNLLPKSGGEQTLIELDHIPPPRKFPWIFIPLGGGTTQNHSDFDTMFRIIQSITKENISPLEPLKCGRTDIYFGWLIYRTEEGVLSWFLHSCAY